MKLQASALWDADVREVQVASLDLEMTGLSPKGDRICEIAVVRGRAGTIEREMQTLVVPQVPMTSSAYDCHGIDDSMLFGAPVFRQLKGDVVSALDGAVLVAHNVHFDLGFLRREMGKEAKLITPVVLDTLAMARRLFRFRKNNLSAVCQQLDVQLTDAHRALADARATFALFFKMASVIAPHGQVTVREVADLLLALAPNSPRRLRQQLILQQAFEQKRSVILTYQSTADPLEGWVEREVSIYHLKLPRFQGFCHLRQAERVFLLDRVRDLRLGNREVVLPTTLNVRI